MKMREIKFIIPEIKGLQLKIKINQPGINFSIPFGVKTITTFQIIIKNKLVLLLLHFKVSVISESKKKRAL